MQPYLSDVNKFFLYNVNTRATSSLISCISLYNIDVLSYLGHFLLSAVSKGISHGFPVSFTHQ